MTFFRDQINVGRMTQMSSRKVKFDRSFKPIKIPIHLEASYSDILKKCRDCLWPDQDEDDHYYLADGSGASIFAGGKFELVSPGIIGEDKRKETLPWTLQNYLRVSKVTYPSRARIYIVKGMLTYNYWYTC